jgi:hypothetical protein
MSENIFDVRSILDGALNRVKRASRPVVSVNLNKNTLDISGLTRDEATRLAELLSYDYERSDDV